MFLFADSRPILAATPDMLRTLLLPLPDRLLHGTEGEGTWTPFQVVCHLTHGEADDCRARVRLMLSRGTSETFKPFDREAGFATYNGWTLAAVLDEFARLRALNLEEIDELRLDERLLRVEGLHPTFGRVTLEQLLAAWVTHDLSHISQIVRVLAHQHSASVGPWKAFLRILQS